MLHGGPNLTVSSVTTSGHDRYAGVVLNPNGGAMTTISVQGTFNEINKMEVRHDTGGTLTALTAPQFTDVVRNSSGAAELQQSTGGSTSWTSPRRSWTPCSTSANHWPTRSSRS